MYGLTLVQFAFSHYCEKVRWALDFKGVPYDTKTLLAGPHRKYLEKLSGQTSVPVLRSGAEIIVGSDRILEWLEARFPTPSLIPEHPVLADAAKTLQKWMDDVAGVQARRALLCHFLQEPWLMADLFSIGRPAYVRIPYRLMFRHRAKQLREERGLTDEAARLGEDIVTETLDRIEATKGGQGYLAGDSFSAADLTTAALMFPLVLPPEFPFEVPHRNHPLVAEWLAKWSNHPATQWIQDIYRKHRRPAGR